jgi:hypothetical protein
MSTAKRIALGIPIDVNGSTPEELALVPGREVLGEIILERRGLDGRSEASTISPKSGDQGKRLEKTGLISASAAESAARFVTQILFFSSVFPPERRVLP